MKECCMFNYSLLFGDHMGKISNEARLYYIKLMFYANNGFVSNPMGVLDSMGYDRGVYRELVNNGEILTLPGRSEVFITSYFVHNRFKPMSWMSSPFALYWKGKLFIKKNGVATFTPQGEEPQKENVGEQVANQVVNEQAVSDEEYEAIVRRYEKLQKNHSDNEYKGI